jgi:c-di-GMP-binding flagellar brake protein YcgR
MPQGDMFIEKRKFKRRDKHYSISYKLMPKDNAIEAVRKNGKSRDISVGGIRVEGEPVGQPDDVLRIEFNLEGREEPVVTFAEIKWIRDIDGINQFGVEFLALKNGDKEMIEQIVND